MNSSGDSNSVPVRVPGSTWSSAISIHDSSHSSGQNDVPLRFEVRLNSDYRQIAVLPDLPTIPGTTRWVTINTEYGRSYIIEMVDDGGEFSLQRGWGLLVAIENFQQGQTLMFEQQEEDFFDVWIHRPSQHPPPTGFSPERIPSPNNNFGPTHLVINPGTEMNHTVLQAIQQVWSTSSVDSPVYVCRLLTNPSEDNSLIFNKSYSSFIPKNHGNIAMRFVGSSIIIPGAIKTSANGSTRLVKHWSLYAREHNLTLGETFVCKIQRGPSTWEFIGFCAGRE